MGPCKVSPLPRQPVTQSCVCQTALKALGTWIWVGKGCFCPARALLPHYHLLWVLHGPRSDPPREEGLPRPGLSPVAHGVVTLHMAMTQTQPLFTTFNPLEHPSCTMQTPKLHLLHSQPCRGDAPSGATPPSPGNPPCPAPSCLNPAYLGVWAKISWKHSQ